MGLKTVPAYIGQAGYDHPVELDRNMLEGVFSRTGAVRYGDFQASTGVGTRAVAVSAGRAFLLGAENAQQGGYFVWSDAVDTFLLGAGVTNPRYDTILLRVLDDQYGVISGSPRAEFEVVQGVAAGSPTPRADSDFNVGGSFYKPGAWWRVADCRVNVGDTTIPGGQIASNNRYVRTPGGMVLCGSTARPSDPVFGDTILETDTGLRYEYNGGAWTYDGNYRQVVTLGSDTATVTFSNVPSTLRNIRLTWVARTTNAGSPNELRMRINGVSTADYYGQFTAFIGLSTTPTVTVPTAVAYARVGAIPGAGAQANLYGSGHVTLPGWNSPHTGGRLAWTAQCGFWDSGTVCYNEYSQWLFVPAGPYTSISFFSAANLVTGSQFTLEGTV